MKYFILALSALICILLPVNGFMASEKPELTISAAASLSDALKEIDSSFETRHPGVKLYLNLGASGVLQKQIEAGAPVDIFISASSKQMDQLENKGLILKETRQYLLSNELVLIVPANSKKEIASFQSLTGSSYKKVAVGNPDIVPAGQYTQEAFKSLNLTEAMASKIILGEDVRQVLEYVARGEVDAGIVYRTDAAILPQKVKVMAEAPSASHKPILYPAAVIKKSKNPELAKEFIAFLSSPESKSIFQKYGFRTVAE